MNDSRYVRVIAFFGSIGLIFFIGLCYFWGNSPDHLCEFKRSLGFPCPLCGLTRSLTFLLSGNIVKSIQLNILGIFVVFTASLLFCVSFVSLLIDSNKIWRKIPWKYYFVFILILVVISWCLQIIK